MLTRMPYVERLAEDTSYLWLTVFALGHVVWLALSIVWAQRVSDVKREVMREGPSNVVGNLESDVAVVVGESFVLRLTSGIAVRVEPQRDIEVRTPTVRAWEREGRLLPNEPLVVGGELRRELLRPGEDYRTAESRWVLRATRIVGLAEEDLGARRARQARTAAVLGGLSSLILVYVAAEHVLLASRGLVTPGQAVAHVETHTVEMQTGRHGGHHEVSGTERSVEVHVRIDGEIHTIGDHLTREGHRHVAEVGDLPVIHTSVAGLTIAQIGSRPGLAMFAFYAFLGELLVVGLALFWIRPRPA